jgi:hypothetical protein
VLPHIRRRRSTCAQAALRWPIGPRNGAQQRMRARRVVRARSPAEAPNGRRQSWGVASVEIRRVHPQRRCNEARAQNMRARTGTRDKSAEMGRRETGKRRRGENYRLDILVGDVLELDSSVLAAHEVRHLVLVEPHVHHLDGGAVGHDKQLVANAHGSLLHLALDDRTEVLVPAQANAPKVGKLIRMRMCGSASACRLTWTRWATATEPHDCARERATRPTWPGTSGRRTKPRRRLPA